MVGSLGKLGLFIAASVALLAYLVHQPIPSDATDFWATQLMCDFIAAVELLCDGMEFLGYSRWEGYELLPEREFNVPEGMSMEIVNLGSVECRIFIPKGYENHDQLSPAIIHYHGGGWTVGSAKSYSVFLAKMAEKTGMLVMSPEYRRSPTYPFPIPYEDCLNSTLEFFQLAEKYNVDPHRIAITGDSAGGNMALAVAINMQTMEDNAYAPKMISLIYPPLQCIDLQLPSYRQNSKYLFVRNLMPKFWLSYMGLDARADLVSALVNNEHVDTDNPQVAKQLKFVDEKKLPARFLSSKIRKAESSNTQLDVLTKNKITKFMLDERFAPLMASDEILKKLPYTDIIVCEYDPLRDDGILLAERLKYLGVPHYLQVLDRSLHGMIPLGVVGQVKDHEEQSSVMIASLKKQLEN